MDTCNGNHTGTIQSAFFNAGHEQTFTNLAPTTPGSTRYYYCQEHCEKNFAVYCPAPTCLAGKVLQDGACTCPECSSKYKCDDEGSHLFTYALNNYVGTDWPKATYEHNGKPTYTKANNLCLNQTTAMWPIVYVPCPAGKIRHTDGKCTCPKCLTTHKCDSDGSYLYTYGLHDKNGPITTANWPKATYKHNGEPTYTKKNNLCYESVGADISLWPMVLKTIATPAPTHTPTAAFTAAPTPVPTPAPTSKSSTLSTGEQFAIAAICVIFIVVAAKLLKLRIERSRLKEEQTENQQNTFSTATSNGRPGSDASALFRPRNQDECRQRLRQADALEFIF